MNQHVLHAMQKGHVICQIQRKKRLKLAISNKTIQPGQEVTVIFQESQGFKALFYGYVLPFLLVFLTLVIAQIITDNEAVQGYYHWWF